jgi:L-threonylcarbamoyladenylate synthase
VVIRHTEDAGRAARGLMDAGARVGLLAPGPLPRELPPDLVILAQPVDTDDYARVLYERLREADRLALDVLVAVAPEPGGVADAVQDRLRRAGAR